MGDIDYGSYAETGRWLKGLIGEPIWPAGKLSRRRAE